MGWVESQPPQRNKYTETIRKFERQWAHQYKGPRRSNRLPRSVQRTTQIMCAHAGEPVQKPYGKPTGNIAKIITNTQGRAVQLTNTT